MIPRAKSGCSTAMRVGSMPKCETSTGGRLGGLAGPYSSEVVATGRYRPSCECGWLGPIFDGRDPSSPWPLDQLWPASESSDAGEHSVVLPEEIDDELMAPWHAHADAIIGIDAVAEAANALRVAEDRLGQTIAVARAAGTSWEVIAGSPRPKPSNAGATTSPQYQNQCSGLPMTSGGRI